MSQPPQQLEYAQHHTRRLPMYAMVLSILAATFLLSIGTLAAVSCIMYVSENFDRERREATTVLLLIAPFSAISLLAGVAQLGGTVRQLRATTARATAIERGFRILNTDFSGRTYEDRYR